MRQRPANAVVRWLALGAAALVALMTVAPGAAYADTAEADFSIGRSDQAQPGESAARLFPVFTSEESRASGEPDLWAYCIENSVPARFDTDAESAGWGEFAGDNSFSTSQVVREKVAWIITNSYPALTLEQLGESIGVPNLSAREAVAGTQYAIWKLTDDVDATLSPNAQTLRNYLLGEANVGLAESDVRTEVTLTVPTGPQLSGTLVGPVTVTTNQRSVAVTTDSTVPVVDANGAHLDLSAVSDGQELYVDARQETTAGSVTFRATATASQVTGSILKVPAAEGSAGSHAQTLILVETGDVSDVAAATLSWDETVAPVMPEVTQAVCTEEGDTTTPSISPATTEGIDYSYDEDEVRAGHTVQVTATAQEGYSLTGAEGWTLSDDGTSATTTVELTEPDCTVVPPPATEVAAVAPEVTQAVCTEEGDTTTPSITPATTEGIDYSYDEDEVRAGRTVQVTATAREGYSLTGAEGWTLSDDGTRATTTVELTEPDCAVAGEETPGAPPAERLPSTGANAIMPLAVAGALVLGGAAAVIRRRSLSL
ncbi:Cys-Gln thioester bond-forming surface protein [Georgenia sp. Marseille-Q6866]